MRTEFSHPTRWRGTLAARTDGSTCEQISPASSLTPPQRIGSRAAQIREGGTRCPQSGRRRASRQSRPARRASQSRRRRPRGASKSRRRVSRTVTAQRAPLSFSPVPAEGSVGADPDAPARRIAREELRSPQRRTPRGRLPTSQGSADRRSLPGTRSDSSSVRTGSARRASDNGGHDPSPQARRARAQRRSSPPER